MKYKIVFHEDMDVFVDMVNLKLEEGWKLQGGLVVDQDNADNRDCFFQALVKED